MNSFDENQNIIEAENTDEFSTVFSDPAAHENVAESKNSNAKKRIISVIAGVLAVVILISSTILVVKLIPEKTDNEVTSSSAPTIKVIEIPESNIKKVTFFNENGNFEMNNTASKDEDGDDVYTWSLKGYSTDVISAETLSIMVSDAIKIYAIREITLKNAEQCGLTDTKIKASIVKNDDTEVTVLIGGKSPDNGGIYVKLSDSDKIYLVADKLDEAFTFTTLDLANTNPISALTLDDKYTDYMTNGSIVSFDSITVSGKNFNKKVVIKPNNDDKFSQYMPYVLTAPVSRIAQNVENALELFSSGIMVDGAYALDASAATVKKFGLNTPDVEVTAKFDDYSYTYKFKKQADGGYAVWHSDCKLILMIDGSSLEILSYDTISFYSTWISFINIEDVSRLDIVSKGKEYKFDITSQESEEDDSVEYTIKHNGKKLTTENFQNLYQYCISLQASDFETEQLSNQPEYEIIYNYNANGKNPTKIAFYRISATKYQFSVDGEMIGKINASDVNRIADYVEKVAKNETIDII